MTNGCYFLPGAEFYIAIDNKGLWPNLTRLPNGEIVAVVYNHPSHGYGNGNVELWVSTDDGRLWSLRSVVTDHSDQPEVVRMNHGVGLNAKGELVVLVGGWSKGRQAPTLPIQVCISADSGRTWRRHGFAVAAFPFGPIILSPDGTLTSAVHDDFARDSRFYVSKDDGQTWGDGRLLADPGDETALLRRRDGTWLAAMRTWPTEDEKAVGAGSGKILLFTSADAGMTWQGGHQVSLQGQAPAHLLELQDGRVLLTYGSRIEGLYGVVARLSDDGGATWSKPSPLIAVPANVDCGYPSSVQVADGTVVTAYYYGPRHVEWNLTRGHGGPTYHAPPWHCRYHMGVARWPLAALERPTG